MPLLLVLMFIVVPLLELYVILQVGGLLGYGWTILLLLADSIAGAVLLKSQGSAAWRRFTEATSQGRIPAREVADGGLIIFGGALLLTPGFLTDIFGLLLLIPPSRAVFRKSLVLMFARRTPLGWIGLKTAPHAERMWNERATRRRSQSRPTVNGEYVEGTASEVDDDEASAAERRRLDP